jgi:protein-S-isoprenylcysteine O-methyltransferase Ste14
MAQPLLAMCMLGAAYMVDRTSRSPNPPPARPNASDALRAALPLTTVLGLGLVIPLLINGAFALTYPSAPLGVCLNPNRINPTYVTWTPWTTAWLAVAYSCGALRLLAYRALGGAFTFELAPPPRLVTTGPYALAQHPSYVPAALVTVAAAALGHNLDGWAACYLPAGVLQLATGVVGTNPSILGAAVAWAVIVGVRVPQEEAMLRRTFGAQWEVWHRKTARLIPGVF